MPHELRASLRAGSSRESDAGRCGGKLPQAASRASYAARSQPSPWRRSGRHAHEKIDPPRLGDDAGRARAQHNPIAQMGDVLAQPVVWQHIQWCAARIRAQGERALGRRRARERPCRPFRAPVVPPAAAERAAEQIVSQ